MKICKSAVSCDLGKVCHDFHLKKRFDMMKSLMAGQIRDGN